MYSESQVQLRVGDQHEITLPEMGAAGYEWIFKTSNSKVDVRRRTGSIRSTRGLIGGPIMVTFELSAISEGRSRVVFEQSRPWERNDIAATHVLQIEILP
jgi:predicted secreted protein